MNNSLKDILKDGTVLSGELSKKVSVFIDELENLGSLAVGFSGGVDSSFLLAAAKEVLGEKVIAVTAYAPFIPEREQREAKEFCEKRGIKQILFMANSMELEEFVHNIPERCYFCKKMIFTEIKRIAGENGIDYVAEGSNLDDIGDYRPGMKAVGELSIQSPLKNAGLTKADIRLLSEYMGLPTWNKPSYACLASRFVYREEITEEKLAMVDGAEQYLIDRGFIQERVRVHGNLARIEVIPDDITRIAERETREAVYREFKKLGFLYVTLDMAGYRTGSMNDVLKTRQKG